MFILEYFRGTAISECRCSYYNIIIFLNLTVARTGFGWTDGYLFLSIFLQVNDLRHCVWLADGSLNELFIVVVHGHQQPQNCCETNVQHLCSSPAMVGFKFIHSSLASQPPPPALLQSLTVLPRCKLSQIGG